MAAEGGVRADSFDALTEYSSATRLSFGDLGSEAVTELEGTAEGAAMLRRSRGRERREECRKDVQAEKEKKRQISSLTVSSVSEEEEEESSGGKKERQRDGEKAMVGAVPKWGKKRRWRFVVEERRVEEQKVRLEKAQMKETPSCQQTKAVNDSNARARVLETSDVSEDSIGGDELGDVARPEKATRPSDADADEGWDMGLRRLLEAARGIGSFARVVIEAKQALDLRPDVDLDRAVLKEVSILTRNLVYDRDPEEELPQLVSVQSFSASCRRSSLSRWSLERRASSAGPRDLPMPARRFSSSFGFGLTLVGITAVMAQLSPAVALRKKPHRKMSLTPRRGPGPRLACTLAIRLPDNGAQARVDLFEPPRRSPEVRTIIDIRRADARPMLRAAKRAAFVDLCGTLECKFAQWHNAHAKAKSQKLKY